MSLSLLPTHVPNCLDRTNKPLHNHVIERHSISRRGGRTGGTVEPSTVVRQISLRAATRCYTLLKRETLFLSCAVHYPS